MKFSINGRKYDEPLDQIAYSEVVGRAFPSAPGSRPTITYKWQGQGDHMRGGHLVPDQVVELADGMHFCATPTNYA